ncbi:MULTISPECIES: winged helix-turn-helix transcriptional regulator [unclassified Chryseobacterium]|uniref:winged helix-turn-helix transcriptional regulator n=1 Tax=unclassified Chryseobacterium TaxID=2593645 RepID=UPI00100AD1C1|nr:MULTISPECIES: helix-turn-helix domain-containing protein [unclassified Chryseobacterium]RXM52826.1 transcriptional regulator [Chryseobacterium sp. CH25]RXM67401.1 transcriptional regulator [Chryseobacterium sp. CH1]
MTAIKESSTIQENKKTVQDCPVMYVMERIGGFWKPIILFNLSTGEKRYSELKKAIPAVTEKMLIQHLKQLESDGLIIRTAKPIVPPHVTYKLSDAGNELAPVIDAMAAWAFQDMERNDNRCADGNKYMIDKNQNGFGQNLKK